MINQSTNQSIYVLIPLRIHTHPKQTAITSGALSERQTVLITTSKTTSKQEQQEETLRTRSDPYSNPRVSIHLYPALVL